MNRLRTWIAVVPAMVLPFLAALCYFVFFSEYFFARIIYGGTKVFTLVWPLLACWLILRTKFPPLELKAARHLKAIPLGLLSGAAVALLAFLLMQTSLGTVVKASAGDIKAKADELGFLRHYWVFAIFLSFFHSLLEEYYWRWFVFGQLRKLLKPSAAHLLAAFCFAAHHIVVATQFFPVAWGVLLGSLVGVGGLLFSLLYARQNTLAGAWLSHMIIDLALMSIGHQLLFG